MNQVPISRRDFLRWVRDGLLTISGLLGLAGLLRFLAYQSQPAPQTEFILAAPADYAPGSRTLLPQVPALLVRNPTGFTAYSLICPHLGCTVDPQSDGFICPCHGSRFDLQGQLTHGPAARSLTTLRLETAPDGKLHLFTN
ncbi:MAG TPA: Rieske (2Fe-2S) protein [Anaerolineales bacterium]|nr:Rieske (2Fe-2S) protein [Anaerolineales bacterium]